MRPYYNVLENKKPNDIGKFKKTHIGKYSLQDINQIGSSLFHASIWSLIAGEGFKGFNMFL